MSIYKRINIVTTLYVFLLVNVLCPSLPAVAFEPSSNKPAQLAKPSGGNSQKSPQQIQSDISRLLENRQASVVMTNERASAAAALLTSTLRRWNPEYSTTQIVSLFKGQESELGTLETIIPTALSIIDVSLSMNERGFANAANAAISMIEPKLGQYLSKNLALADFSQLDEVNFQDATAVAFKLHAIMNEAQLPAPKEITVPSIHNGKQPTVSFEDLMGGPGSRLQTKGSAAPDINTIAKSQGALNAAGPISGNNYDKRTCEMNCAKSALAEFSKEMVETTAKAAGLTAISPLVAVPVFLADSITHTVDDVEKYGQCKVQKCEEHGAEESPIEATPTLSSTPVPSSPPSTAEQPAPASTPSAPNPSTYQRPDDDWDDSGHEQIDFSSIPRLGGPQPGPASPVDASTPIPAFVPDFGRTCDPRVRNCSSPNLPTQGWSK